VFGQIHRATPEHNTSTLDGFDEVFAGESDEAEPCLVGVEFEDTPQSLLGYSGEIVGVIQEHPGNCIRNGANAAHEFRESLADGGDSTIIGGTQTQRHRRLMGWVGYTLVYEMFRDPGIGQHRFTDARWSTQNKMRRIIDL